MKSKLLKKARKNVTVEYSFQHTSYYISINPNKYYHYLDDAENQLSKEIINWSRKYFEKKLKNFIGKFFYSGKARIFASSN